MLRFDNVVLNEYYYYYYYILFVLFMHQMMFILAVVILFCAPWHSQLYGHKFSPLFSQLPAFWNV